MMPTPETKKMPLELQEVEIKQEVDSPLSVETDEADFERGTQWLVNLLPKPTIQSKRARLANIGGDMDHQESL